MIKFKINAASVFKASIISPSDSWSLSREQWRYASVLELLQGRELPLVGPIFGGRSGQVYALLPDTDAFNTLRSRVIAVNPILADEIDLDDNLLPPPINKNDRDKLQNASEYVLVRLLTIWSDGTSAFTINE